MSLLQLFSGLLDKHGDTAQQAALLAYLKNGEEAQPYLEAVLTARLDINWKHVRWCTFESLRKIKKSKSAVNLSHKNSSEGRHKASHSD